MLRATHFPVATGEPYVWQIQLGSMLHLDVRALTARYRAVYKKIYGRRAKMRNLSIQILQPYNASHSFCWAVSVMWFAVSLL